MHIQNNITNKYFISQLISFIPFSSKDKIITIMFIQNNIVNKYFVKELFSFIPFSSKNRIIQSCSFKITSQMNMLHT